MSDFKGLYVDKDCNPIGHHSFEQQPPKELMSCQGDEQELHFHLADGRRLAISELVDTIGELLADKQDREQVPETSPGPFIPGRCMAFGPALEYIKDGMRLARQGWNAPGQFVYLVPAASYPAQTGAAKAFFGEGSMVPYEAYFALKNAQDRVSTWVPSTGDLLAKDWYVLPTPPAR